MAIYNAAIPAHQATADLAPVSVQDREAWFAAHDPSRRPLWVAVGDGDQVLGWLSFSTFYDRPAWDPTVEVSFYVHPDWQRRGVGRALLSHALATAPALGISNVLAIVFGHNEASIELLESAGFEHWGFLPEVTHMPEGRRDVVILGWKLALEAKSAREGSAFYGREAEEFAAASAQAASEALGDADEMRGN